MNATIVQKDNEKKTVRLVNEARLKELLWGELPEEERPTRRTLLTWRESGVLPSVKMGTGAKAKVFYDLDGCLASVEKLTVRRKRRVGGRQAVQGAPVSVDNAQAAQTDQDAHVDAARVDTGDHHTQAARAVCRQERQTMSIREIALHDLHQTAFHEAGHLVVARHFGLGASARIWRNDSPGRDDSYFRGQTGYEHTTVFRTAVICWAGVVAECMGDEDAMLDEAELTPGNELVELFQLIARLSETDLRGIQGHPQTRRTFRTALRILRKNRSELEREAKWHERIMEDANKSHDAQADKADKVWSYAKNLAIYGVRALVFGKDEKSRNIKRAIQGAIRRQLDQAAQAVAGHVDVEGGTP